MSDKFLRYASLRRNKRYLHVFAVFLVVAVILAASVKLGSYQTVSLLAAVFPTAGLAILMFVQIRSGVALDHRWKASYPRGTTEYRAMMTLNFVALAAFACISAFIIATLLW